MRVPFWALPLRWLDPNDDTCLLGADTKPRDAIGNEEVRDVVGADRRIFTSLSNRFVFIIDSSKKYNTPVGRVMLLYFP